jgi:hypothetical protein
MEADRKKWLVELGGQAALQKALHERQATRDAVMARAAAAVSMKAAEIYAGMNKKATRSGDKKKGGLSLLDEKGRGQIEEFDLDEMQDGYALDTDDHEAQLKAQHIAEQIAMEFDVRVDKIDRKTGAVIMKEIDEVDATGALTGKKIQVPDQERLFAEEELGPVLYQPLVRQGLLPETLVPNKYSATHEMLKGSFDAYAERLKSERPKDFWGENKGLIIQAGKTVAALGSAAGTLNASANVTAAKDHAAYDFEDQSNYTSFFSTLATAKNSDKLTDISSATDLIAFSVGVASTLNDAREDLGGGDAKAPEHADPAAAARSAQAGLIAQQMVAEASARLASAIDAVAPDVGIVASSAFGAMVKAPALAAHIRAGKGADLRRRLADAYEKAILACDPKTATSTPAMAAAGLAMKAAFETNLKEGDLQAALETPDLAKAHVLVGDAAEAAANVVSKQKAFADQIKDPANRDAMSKGMAAAVNKVFEDEQAEARAADLADEKALAAARELKADGIKVAGLIDRKIKALKKQQALIKWSATLAGMGFDMASKVIAPLAIGGSAVALAQNILLAVQRTRDFAAWVDSNRDMIRAASPYSSAVTNFTKNAAIQALHYEISAAVELVKIIGAVTECSGLGAAAGKAVQAGATIAGAIEGLLYEAKKRYDLEKAWSQYRLALTRPESRKLGLVAIRENPTLAKYAVAYGCCEKKDPIVGDFMDKCGLTAETLQDENANVDKVVEYLEARMPDDIVVVGREVALGNWAPSPIVLTSLCWASAKNRAVKDAGLQAMETRAVDAALFELEQVSKRIASNPVLEDVKQGLTLANLLIRNLGTVKPIHEKERVAHREMEDFVSTFRSLANARRTEIMGSLAPLLVAGIGKQLDALDGLTEAGGFAAIEKALTPAKALVEEVRSVGMHNDAKVQGEYAKLATKTQQLEDQLLWKDLTLDWSKPVASWESARDKGKLKKGTHLTSRLKEVESALKKKDKEKKAALAAAVQGVIDNIDAQLSASPAIGFAQFLRQMKTGARSLAG